MTANTDASDTTLIERIKARLTALQTKPATAAINAGLHRNFLHDILIGKKTGRSAKSLQKTSSALRCSVSYLLGDTDETGDPTPGEPLVRGAVSEDTDPVEKVILQHRSGLTTVYSKELLTTG